MRFTRFAGMGLMIGLAGLGPAHAQDAVSARFSTVDSTANPYGPLLPRNRSTDVGGVQVACVANDRTARADPRWGRFPVKLEFARDGGGVFLDFAQVTVRDEAGEQILAVRCPGAWLALGLSPGTYQASVAAPPDRIQDTTFSVPPRGQKSVVLHFP